MLFSNKVLFTSIGFILNNAFIFLLFISECSDLNLTKTFLNWSFSFPEIEYSSPEDNWKLNVIVLFGGVDSTGFDSTGLDSTGLDSTGLDSTGLDSTGLDTIGVI